MKKMQRRVVCGVAALAVAWFTIGCTTVEYTGRKQLMLYNESDDIAAGTAAWQEILKTEKAVPDSPYLPALERVGKNVAAAAGRPQYQWEFKVFESTEANAFALPGGKVAFYTPIFAYMDNDAELATVVSHEVAHALARHGMERQSQGVVQSLGLLPISLWAESDSEAETMANVYMGVTNVGAMLPYSRAQESEADHIGLLLMAKAGYDPQAAIRFWEKFGGSDTTGILGAFLSTHPTGPDRIAAMRQELPEAMALYRQAPVQRGLGETITHPNPSAKASSSSSTGTNTGTKTNLKPKANRSSGANVRK